MGQKHTHESVDERFELEYQSNFGMACRITRRRRPTILQPAQRLAENQAEYSGYHSAEVAACLSLMTAVSRERDEV